MVAAVEVGGNVPQEIAEQVAEETADQITSAADAVPEIAAEPEAAVLENGSAPAVVDQTTTVTEDTPGEVVVETTETAEQPTAIAEEPAATTVTIEEVLSPPGIGQSCYLEWDPSRLSWAFTHSCLHTGLP